jgi:hypothetical protein
MIRKLLAGILAVCLTLPIASQVMAEGATIILNPSTAKPGEVIKLTSQVSIPGNDFEIYWDGLDKSNVIVPRTPTLSSVVTLDLKIPEASRGQHRIYVLDMQGTQPASSIDFNVMPGITIESVQGVVDGTVKVNGRGFMANEASIKILFDGISVGNAPNADAKGSWTFTATVPPAASGVRLIGASGSTSTAEEVGQREFTVSPRISISPPTGSGGTLLSVKGTGWAANEKNIMVTVDGEKFREGISADANGSWTENYTIPPGTARGKHIVGASGSVTARVDVPVIEFQVTTLITISPDTGKAGTKVTVNGSGFEPKETGIHVTFDGSVMVEDMSLTADAQGKWTAQVEIPVRSGGRHTIRAQGDKTLGGDVPGAVFTILPGVTAGPLSGAPGTEVTVTGSGMASGKPVTVTYDKQQVAEGVATTSGAVSIKFTVPAGQGGSHSIEVKDSTGAVTPFTFNLQTTAPAAPKLTEPLTGVRLTFFGGAKPNFKWEGSGGQGKLTYTLQVGAKSDFSTTLITKKGLDAGSYLVTDKEAFENGVYYWRVMATDETGNAGPWSETRSFDVGVMAAWLFWTIVGVPIAAGLAVAFIFWRRRGAYDF